MYFYFFNVQTLQIQAVLLASHITLKDIDGNGSSGYSSLESVLTDSNGFWYAERVNIHTKDYQNLFDFTENVDNIFINVDAGMDGDANFENVILR
ncbi:MAG: hypothetical protein HQK75_02745 [Candidatus Magnetomorum sp.]|nr:hypothetical protein [Candidatus Magnetomorum sp.]